MNNVMRVVSLIAVSIAGCSAPSSPEAPFTPAAPSTSPAPTGFASPAPVWQAMTLEDLEVPSRGRVGEPIVIRAIGVTPDNSFETEVTARIDADRRIIVEARMRQISATAQPMVLFPETTVEVVPPQAGTYRLDALVLRTRQGNGFTQPHPASWTVEVTD